MVRKTVAIKVSTSSAPPSTGSSGPPTPTLTPTLTPTPSSGGKKRSFTVEEKLAIVRASRAESLRAVARRFHVDRNCIRSWRDKEAQLAAMHPTARRLPGAGRRPAVIASPAGTSPSPKRQRPETPSVAPTVVATAAVSTTPVTAAPPIVTDFVLVGFQGKEGAFSDVAARRAFGELRDARALTPNEFETVGYAQMSHVLEAVERGEVAFGVLPVENSVSGTFHGILDRLVASHLKIVGEIACMQELCLCALPGAPRERIDCLLSHPAVLGHCEEFICDLERKNGAIVDRQATWDSAGACQMVRQENTPNVAAIASEQAALAHGLVVLENGVGDELNNETRYMILGRLDATPLPLGQGVGMGPIVRKASVVIAVPNEPQALFKVVAAFALRNVMIVKIESRPASTAGYLFAAQTHHWDYIFYLDYLESADPTVEASLRRQLEEFALWVKDLGSYSSSAAPARTNVEPPRWKSGVGAIAC